MHFAKLIAGFFSERLSIKIFLLIVFNPFIDSSIFDFLIGKIGSNTLRQCLPTKTKDTKITKYSCKVSKTLF